MAEHQGELKIPRDDNSVETTVTPQLISDIPSPSPSPYAIEEASTPELAHETVTWTASEFIAHEKSPSWYVMLAVAALFIAALVYLVTKDRVSTGVIIFAGIILGVYASRQPRQLNYELSSSGIGIGQRHYSFDEFRSFAIMQDGAFAYIALMPLKRFLPVISMYYAPQDEARIISVLASYLPHEERKPDLIDNFMRHIRF